MKVPKSILTREANLSFEELEILADEIRTAITGDKAYTLREYMHIVSSTDINALGYRKGRAILFEPKLEAYFPDDVYTSLKEKGREGRNHQFDEDDDSYIKCHVAQGLDWLADRFYTEREVVSERVTELELRDRLPKEDLKVEDTEDDREEE